MRAKWVVPQCYKPFLGFAEVEGGVAVPKKIPARIDLLSIAEQGPQVWELDKVLLSPESTSAEITKPPVSETCLHSFAGPRVATIVFVRMTDCGGAEVLNHTCETAE